MLSFFAKASASVMECDVENSDGKSNTRIFSVPMAYAANASTTAESSPPESPRVAVLKLFFAK